MIRKLNSNAVRSMLNDYQIDPDYVAVSAELVERGHLAAFYASTSNVNQIGAYVRRRFPAFWRDYLAVSAAPNYLDFVYRSGERGLMWPELTLPEGTIWLIDLDA